MKMKNILIVGAVVAVGWYLWKRNQNTITVEETVVTEA